MNNSEKQKCVMISADHGLAIVYFLQTDVVQTMLDEGIRVVVLTDDGVVDKVREKFGQEGLFVEGLRLDACKKYFNEVDHTDQYWLHFLLSKTFHQIDRLEKDERCCQQQDHKRNDKPRFR